MNRVINVTYSDLIDAHRDVQMIMLAKKITFTPVVGFRKISETKQITGIIATLYIVRSKVITPNVFASLQKLFPLTASIITIRRTVAMLVNTSHKIDATQNRVKLIPLAYCRNLARQTFSCNGERGLYVNQSCNKKKST